MRKIKGEYLLLALVGLVILAGVFLLIYQKSQSDQLMVSLQEPVSDTLHEVQENNVEGKSKNVILVHIAGEVQTPGVYELSENARVYNAIQAAGGETPLADLDSLNLAAKVYDGDKIMVPVKEFFQNKKTAGISPGQTGNSGDNKININTASASELQELSGIGPSKAESIIDYRNEAGLFQKKEDLLNVVGIGKKTLEKIKDEIILW